MLHRSVNGPPSPAFAYIGTGTAGPAACATGAEVSAPLGLLASHRQERLCSVGAAHQARWWWMAGGTVGRQEVTGTPRRCWRAGLQAVAQGASKHSDAGTRDWVMEHSDLRQLGDDRPCSHNLATHRFHLPSQCFRRLQGVRAGVRAAPNAHPARQHGPLLRASVSWHTELPSCREVPEGREAR